MAPAVNNSAMETGMALVLTEKEMIKVQLAHKVIHGLIGNNAINVMEQHQPPQPLAIGVLQLHRRLEGRWIDL